MELIATHLLLLLVSQGADVAAVDSQDNSARDFALRDGRTEVAAWLDGLTAKKECSVCKALLPKASFSKKQLGQKGRRKCKDCAQKGKMAVVEKEKSVAASAVAERERLQAEEERRLAAELQAE